MVFIVFLIDENVFLVLLDDLCELVFNIFLIIGIMFWVNEVFLWRFLEVGFMIVVLLIFI